MKKKKAAGKSRTASAKTSGKRGTKSRKPRRRPAIMRHSKEV